jgi:hypothetical protein
MLSSSWSARLNFAAGCLTMLGIHALIVHEGQTLVAGIEIFIGFCFSMAADVLEKMPQ